MPRRRYWIYLLLFFLNTISYTDRVNMSIAGHSIAVDFHLSPVALGFLFASFLWAYVIVMLPGGTLIDAIGMHRVAAIAATIWSLAQIGTGLAGGFATMLLARLGLGVGEAPVSPISYRAVRDWGPFTEHGTAISAIQSGTQLGPAVGSVLVALLIAATSWRTSFYVTGAIGLVWVVIWVAFVSTPERTRWLSDAERNKILAERHVTQTGMAAGPAVGYFGLLLSPSMWGLAISQGCAVYSLYLYLSWLPDYLQTERHVSMVHSGLFTSVPFLVGAVVIVVVNWFGDVLLSPDALRSGKRRNIVILCLVLTAAGMAIPFASSIGMVVFLTILPVSFSNAATATNAALTSDLLHSPADAGRAFAFLVLGGNLFGLMAPIVTGYLVSATGSFVSAFVLAGVLALVGAATSFALTRFPIGDLYAGTPAVSAF